MEKNKLLHKIRDGRKNVRADELRKLMDLFGFKYRKTKHAVWYTHQSLPQKIISVVEHREKRQENKILVRYVNKCIVAIDELLLIKGGGGND